MTRTNTQYSAAGTAYQIPEVDGDLYDRDNQFTPALIALEEHDHSVGRGKEVLRVGAGIVNTVAIADGAVTDLKVGERTGDPSLIPSTVTGTLTQLFSWIMNRIKAITGASNWYDAPAITLASLAVHGARHAPAGADPLNLAAYNVWTSLNDGTGSGLDADLIDGKNITVSASAPSSPNSGDLWIDTSA